MNGERCPKCNSTQTYLRIKTKELVCRSCGKISESAKVASGKKAKP